MVHSMNKLWQFSPGVLLAITMLVTPSTTRAQTYPTIELSGDWEGQMLLRSNWRFMEARFGRGGDPAEVKVDLPQERREFRDFERQGNRLHGADDVDVRATTNSALLARLSSHSSSRQRVFKDADHYMLVTPKDPDRNYRRLSEGYVQTTIDWIKQVSR